MTEMEINLIMSTNQSIILNTFVGWGWGCVLILVIYVGSKPKVQETL